MVDPLFRKPGWAHEIWYICDGTGTFQDFVNELQATGLLASKVRGDQALADRPVSPKEWRQLIQTIEKIGQHGYRKLARTNVVKTWTEDDGTPVAEIRKGQLRVLFFEDKPDEDPDRLILTHGFLKKTDETPRNEIRRYRRLRRRYFNWKFEASDDG